MRYIVLAILVCQLGLPVAFGQPAEADGPTAAADSVPTAETPNETVAQPIQGVVTTLNNRKLEGAITELTGENVTIQTADELVSVELRNLMTIQLAERRAADPADATAWLELQGGSLLVTSRFKLVQRTAQISLDDRKLSIPGSRLRAVRFYAPSELLDPQWHEALQTETAGDLLVVRRDATSLDQLGGVVNDIDATTVDFSLDGEQIPVKRTKLEGIVFFQPPGMEIQKSLCEVHETSSSVWRVKSLALQQAGLRLVTTCGVEHVLPLDRIQRLDFSSGNITFLSDLEPESVEWSPYFASPASYELLAQLYLPRRDSSFDGKQLWLGEGRDLVRYDKGLAIHSRTRLVYRFQQDYRRLTAVAGIDSRLRNGGHVLLTILGDNRQLFQQAISGKDAPVNLDVNLEGVDRLTILVDFGEMGDIADHLNLCDARILK